MIWGEDPLFSETPKLQPSKEVIGSLAFWRSGSFAFASFDDLQSLWVNPFTPHGDDGIWKPTRWWQLRYFLFSLRIPGEMIQFEEHIFQMGWNHQLAYIWHKHHPQMLGRYNTRQP